MRVVLPASTWARMPRLSEACGRAGTRDPFEVAEADGSVRSSHLAASFSWVSRPGRPVAATVRRAGAATPRVFVRAPAAAVGCPSCWLVGASERCPWPVRSPRWSCSSTWSSSSPSPSSPPPSCRAAGGSPAGRRCCCCILWWMYGGYAWLTNAAPPVTPRRQALLVLGMIGNFVTAMAIPHAYGADRVVFAAGYLLVVVVHAGMYVTEARRITRGMVVQLLGWNMLGALLGLVGALFFEDILVWWWLGAFVVAVVLPRLVRITSLEPGRGRRRAVVRAGARPLRRAARADAADRARGVGAGDRGRARHRRRGHRVAADRVRRDQPAARGHALLGLLRRRRGPPRRGGARRPVTRAGAGGRRSRRTAMRSS